MPNFAARIVPVWLLLLASCSFDRDDPVAVAKEFIREARSEACGESLRFFTDEVQESAHTASREARRDQPFVTDNTLPGQIFCLQYRLMKPGSVSLVAQRGDTAQLHAVSSEGTRFLNIPFLSTPYKEWNSKLTLVKTDSGWRVTHPLLRVKGPRPDELDFGPITVTTRGSNSDRKYFRLNGPVAASPEDVEAVLLDYESWSRWIPHLVESRVLRPDSTRKKEIIYGRFLLAPDGPAADYVVRSNVGIRVRDHEWRGFNASWHTSRPAFEFQVPGKLKPSITYFSYVLSFRRSEWVRQPGAELRDTVNVTLDWAGKPDEWPAQLASGVLSPEFGVRFVRGLEREAQARANAGRIRE
jgi:hypothetical protein